MAIDWAMSAALENVARGDSEVPEVTSLRGAVRAWQGLDGELQAAAILTPERPVTIGGDAVASFAGQAIGELVGPLDAAD